VYVWSMKRTSMYLAEGQVAALDRIAEAEGVSRSEVIRELIDRAIGEHPDGGLAAYLAAINASFGIVAGRAKDWKSQR
jgi:metal-responsive CopG/Arc/MetJ family transcriptional regulator